MPPCPHSGSPPLPGVRDQTDSFSPTPTSEVQEAAPCPAASPSPDLLGLNLWSPTVQQAPRSKSAAETASSWVCQRDGGQKRLAAFQGESPRRLQPPLCVPQPLGGRGQMQPQRPSKAGSTGRQTAQPSAQGTRPGLPCEPEADLTFTKATPTSRSPGHCPDPRSQLPLLHLLHRKCQDNRPPLTACQSVCSEGRTQGGRGFRGS